MGKLFYVSLFVNNTNKVRKDDILEHPHIMNHEYASVRLISLADP